MAKLEKAMNTYSKDLMDFLLQLKKLEKIQQIQIKKLKITT
jgi:hypothetical protein